MTSLVAIAPVDHAGGAEIGLLRLLPRLREAGWAVTLTAPGAGPVRDAGLALGLAVERLPVGGLAAGAGTRALASFPAARRLARAHDVVYLNGTVAGRLLPAVGAARTVLHVHDLVDRVPRFWSRADVILADSRAAADRLGPLAERAHVVGCPVDPDPPPVAAPWGEPNGRPVVGYVGRIEPRKGVLDLVMAVPGMAGARVVVVGDDPFGSDPGYLDEVNRAEGIERYPWVDGAAGLMGALDVLVLPSREEPFGTVLAEAMNAGTPVVATRVGGLPEVVEDGVTGRLVEPGDPAALAAAVREVLARRDEMGAAARVRARRWHAGAYADRIAELIAP
jgi:glycosyltransferase involved in cell wall biosynthesis